MNERIKAEKLQRRKSEKTINREVTQIITKGSNAERRNRFRSKKISRVSC